MASTDFCTQAKAFDETKAGVKGLADAGIKDLPAMFHAAPEILSNPKPPSTLLTIPTIDLKGGILNKNDQDPITRQTVVEKIGEASAKLGFFQVINHGIPVEVMNKMRQGICDFHEQDPELKKPFYSRDHTRNLVYYSNVDLHSSETANWRDTFACYMAPDPPKLDELPAVCGEIMLEYSRQMTKLGELLFELLSEALGLKPNHFKDMDCAKYQMMLGQYYPPCPRPDLTLGLSKHADFSFLTVLLQANIGGLQVLYDDYWIDVPPIPEAFVINIGDLLQLITNDRFISSEHRVLANASNGPRASVPYFFSSFKRENHQVYGPIKELLSEDNPAKYRDFTISEFAKIFNSKEIFTRKILHFRI